ncbi:hypothetical protein [Bdellovibrio sp. HCB-110]|uniref:hypothetical protein n=1 Tax=Bdellovibrio sp. HCB-110 TaxID=3391182 RepID=UPI0039B5B2D3
MVSRHLLVILNRVSPLKLFYHFFGLALVARVVSDIFEVHRWSIHLGEIFPYRHLFEFIPLYSTSLLVVEWGLLLIGALLIFRGKNRWGSAFALVGLVMSLSQMFQNQKVLLTLVAFALTVGPRLNENALFKKNDTANFLKWQILLIYLISAVSKIFDQFQSGETLRIMSEQLLLQDIGSREIYSVGAWLVILVELALPLLLLTRPRLGIAGVVLVHGGFSLFLSDIWPFSLAMIALSFLFLKSPDSKIPDQRLVEIT